MCSNWKTRSKPAFRAKWTAPSGSFIYENRCERFRLNWAKGISGRGRSRNLKERVEKTELPEDVQKVALKEVERLSQMMAMSPEVSIIRNYVDWILDLPWKEQTEDNLDVTHAGEVLERYHYGLGKAKDRILEYIAVRSLKPKRLRQPILCFVGPPGTGKTSLGKSIAEALGRKFVRVSLGGVRDEAEIRGHRRTYIGAMPGQNYSNYAESWNSQSALHAG